MTTSTLLRALCAYVPRDRVEHIVHPDTPLATDGVALIADISGFTPLTEALTHNLQADQGAEELTSALEKVFTPLIEEVHAYYGSVIKFGGDALIVWFPRSPREHRSSVIRRAITSAWRMQAAIQVHGQVPTPIGTIGLQMKVGLTYGTVKRFNLGSAQFGYEDVLGGATLDRMADAEHHAEPGDIMLDRATLDFVPNAVAVAEWRDEFAVIADLLRPARPKPWPALDWPSDATDTLIEHIRTYVPDQIYQVLESGRSQVAELKPVVSLFIQFQGIDYDGDPAVSQKLQTYFSTAQTIAVQYGGRVNRLITGDKGSLIHVIFGAPKTVEEQEVRAVRCALDLQRECGGLPYITMQRIGITEGRVFAGPVGSPNRHDYTTMGDSINLSARLMQNAADDQILLAEAVRRPLPNSFDIADLGEIMVKGKAAPIPVFAALSAEAQSNRTSDRLIRPIIGRDKELATLQNRLGQLVGGQGGIMALIGEVGMGKTHMLAGLQVQVVNTLKIDWADGLCLAYGQTLSGYLFIDLLRSLISLPVSADPDQASIHLADFCRDLFGPDRLEATYPYLARFMGLPLADELAQRIEGLSGESLRWQLFEVFRTLIRALMARRPLVLALDDLQWADPTSIQLLEALLPLVSEGPLILLLAMRPERDSRAWGLVGDFEKGNPADSQESDSTSQGEVKQSPSAPQRGESGSFRVEPEEASTLTLTLSPLDHTDAASLIAHFAPDLPEPMLDYLVDKSGGNPLFLVEIVRTLEAQGLLAADANIANIDLGALDLPNSVQELLLAQIDRLTIEARHTLQMASVIGKTFLYKVLDELAAGQRNLDDQLLALEDHDYINQDQDAATDFGLAYIFRHGLIQESAYGTLLYQRRRAYHRQVAQILERLFPTQLMEQAGLLAYHYEQAEDLDHAITYHLQAADNARLIWANEEAEMLYQKALTLFDLQEETGQESNLDRRAKTYLKLAHVYSSILDFETAQDYYDQAFDLLEQIESAALDSQSPGFQPLGENRVIRLGVGSFGPSTLDPALVELSDVTEIIKDLFEGLVELDAELNVIPAVARRWQVDHTGLQYQFELRSGLKWSDGQPLTAHDFVYAWRRNLSPQTKAGMAHQLFIVDGAKEYNQRENTDPETVSIKALDDTHLLIRLNTSASYFPYLLTNPITFPQPAHNMANQSRNGREIVCNGPFIIEDWQDNTEIHLVRNHQFRGYQPGNLEEVILRFVDPNIDEYQNGSIDWCRVEDRADIPTLYPKEVSLIQYMTTFLLGFACNTYPFNHKSIRKAFAHCIDQQALTQTVWANAQKAADGGIIPPSMIGHSPEIGLNFNPDYARALLKQAGLSSSENHPTFRLATPQWFGDTPSFLQSVWAKYLDINVEIIENISIEEALKRFSQGDIQLILLGWEAEYPDPDGILRTLFHSNSPVNYFGWQNDQFDQLVDQAASASDQNSRLANYHQADQILVAQEAAIVPLYYNQAYSLLKSQFSIEGFGKVIRGGTFKFKHISMN